MNHFPFPDRCRVVLTYDIMRGISSEMFADILKAGDVAGVIIYNSGEIKNDPFFRNAAQKLVTIIQGAHIPAIIAGNRQIAEQVHADGIHQEKGDHERLHTAITGYHPAMISGYGNLQNRHSAVLVGEMQPDYVFFGKLGKDRKPEPHPRNLDLGEWWAAMIVIPCIVQAGSNLESVISVASAGVEFVALEEAVFTEDDMPQALYQANHFLDLHAARSGGINTNETH